MSDFKMRALEIHSAYCWDFDWVTRAIRFCKEHDLTTLILHRNDIVEQVTYPGQYFGCTRGKYANIFERYADLFRVAYKYTPTRRSGPVQRRAYLKRVVEQARRLGIDVWVENKELSFPEILLEFHPELVKGGKVCANDPFWWEFTRAKYVEFFEEFPEISGVITAPATGESRISITSNRCTCERCRATAPQEWFSNLIAAMYEPIKAAGKQLVIRDFVFNRQAHEQIARTMEQLPGDIIIALKNTPHDYYPTFPDNPRLGKVGAHDQWIEFDTMGQYFGWGIGISIMIDDMRRRLKVAKGLGVSGVMYRTDWESLEAHSCFQTPNFVNLFAGAALANDLNADSAQIYRQWLIEKGFLAPGLSVEKEKATATWVESILEQSWDVIRRTVYVNDCVFSDSSTLPVSMEHALWLAEEKNQLKEWDPSKVNALSVDEENVRRIMAEKDDALTLIERMSAQARQGAAGLTAAAQSDLVNRLEIFARYVRAFRAATHAIILTKYLLQRDAKIKSRFADEAPAIARARLQDLLALAKEFEEFYASTAFQYTVYTLLDPERLTALHGDLSRQLNGII
ncbi:MAG: hypothetical protein AB1817_08210 [Chloroflexota bacterium]